jgi:hypothetical protein
VKPTEYETEPSPSCERQPYKSASGDGLMIVPPRPGLSAKAVSERSEVSWWFEWASAGPSDAVEKATCTYARREDGGALPRLHPARVATMLASTGAQFVFKESFWLTAAAREADEGFLERCDIRSAIAAAQGQYRRG